MRLKTFAVQTRLNGYGEERVLRRPITLPKLTWQDAQPEIDDTTVRFAEYRTVKRGLEAWQAVNRAESFDGWRAIGAALAVGKAHALRVTGANAAWGQHYSREFGKWMKVNGFDRMQKSTRSVAIELCENANAIEAWRATLSERQRKRLVHPLSNVRRWRAATTDNGKCPQDFKRDAMAAWRRFVSCVGLLPSDQAAPLWRAVSDAMAGDKAPPHP